MAKGGLGGDGFDPRQEFLDLGSGPMTQDDAPLGQGLPVGRRGVEVGKKVVHQGRGSGSMGGVCQNPGPAGSAIVPGRGRSGSGGLAGDQAGVGNVAEELVGGDPAPGFGLQGGGQLLADLLVVGQGIGARSTMVSM